MVHNLAEHAEQISLALQLHAKISAEGNAVLRTLEEKLSELNRKMAPIHDRATALTWAEENITLAKAEMSGLLQHIDASRKVESVLRLGPGRSEAQLDQYLGAVGRLEEALAHLEGHLQSAEGGGGGRGSAVEQAYDNAMNLYDNAMRDCEADFAAVLAQHGAARLPSAAWLAERASPENLQASLSQPELELLPPAAASRVSRLAEAMLRARHVTCLDTYAQARSRALDMLLALVGLDPSALLPHSAAASGASGASGAGPSLGLSLQSSDQLQRLVGGWAVQLRVLLVGAAAELALAQDVWPSPYDEVTFSETISRSLRLVLQVGKAVCEGRGVGRSPDRVFVLLQMHQSLRDLLPYLDDLLSPRERCTGLLNEAHLLGVMIGRAARQLFGDFEESVGGRGLRGGGGGGPYGSSEAVSKLTMLDGTVHPICATTLSFLKRLFSYPNALPLLFAPGGGGGAGSVSASGGGGAATSSGPMEAAVAAAAGSIMRILMRLLEALESKARVYKAPALGDLFLMNNVHYMVWTVEQAAAAEKQAQLQQHQQQQHQRGKGAASTSATTDGEAGGANTEDRGGGGGAKRRAGGDAKRASAGSVSEDGSGFAAAAAAPSAAALAAPAPVGGGLGVLGGAWVERHKDIVEAYGAAYHDKTWRPVIALLEGVLVTEEDVEPSEPGKFKAWLKAKFTKLNSQLDAIIKQQSAWTIPDAKLKAAVRNVIKQDLLPLYGEFWDRYTAVDFTTHPDKYLRYPPEQLEFLIDHALFEGRAAAAPRGAGGGPPGSGTSGGGTLPPPPLSTASSSIRGSGAAAVPPPGAVRGGSQPTMAAAAARPASTSVPAGGRAKSSAAVLGIGLEGHRRRPGRAAGGET